METISLNKTVLETSSGKYRYAHYAPKRDMSILLKPTLPVRRVSLFFGIQWPVLVFLFLGATTPNWALASMKLSVSLRFRRSWTVSRTPWAGDQLFARPLPVHKHRKMHTHTHTHTETTNIHTLSGIRTHDPSFRASEDSSCLRPLDYYDRHYSYTDPKFL
jgi:hypothetical protein